MLEASRLLTLPGMFDDPTDFLARNGQWTEERRLRIQEQQAENQRAADVYPFAPAICDYSRTLVAKTQQDLGLQAETLEARMRRMEEEAAERRRDKMAQIRRVRGESAYFKPKITSKGRKVVPLVSPVFDRLYTRKNVPIDHSRSPSPVSPSSFPPADEVPTRTRQSKRALSPKGNLASSASLSPSLSDSDAVRSGDMGRRKKGNRLWKKLGKSLWDGVLETPNE
eukprot:GEMP01024868.1.p1 GENE.GEMP01024868.1~~GEMP01024868.1.p1  ORF type:complete len:225 (+),score=70.07 GEMP01024868.1:1253-1927(+)